LPQSQCFALRLRRNRHIETVVECTLGIAGRERWNLQPGEARSSRL